MRVSTPMGEAAVAIAQALVRILSVNPTYDAESRGEGAVVAWLQEWAARNRLDAELQDALPGRPNLLIRLRNGADRPVLLLNGHTDTVGVQGMSSAPFGGELSGGRLWGRGSADMKGPLACMLSAALRLRD